MKRVTLLVPCLFMALMLAACSKSDRTSSAPSDNQMASRTDKGVTASDQPENATDRKIIQDVRQALTSDSSLSTSAQNVTVVSNNGKVTLRGSVKDESEKQKIIDKATQVAGANNIDNQLTVTQ